jgi:glycine hydroxymethyltransferase
MKNNKFRFLLEVDNKIGKLVSAEDKRQEETLMMIPSENIISDSVKVVLGSCLSNKYSEGYPEKKYYQGQKYTNQIEKLTIERAKKVFGVPYVNVQPLSGSNANLAVYNALLEPEEKIMGLSLTHGGHLTHGADASVVSTFYHTAEYHLNANKRIDYQEIEKKAKKGSPKVIIAGTTSYPRKLNWKKFGQIAKKVDAYLVADISHVAGLVVGGVYPDPIPHVDVVTTTTHKTLRGPKGALIMVTENGLSKNKELGQLINAAVFPGLQGGPHMNNIAGIGVALKEVQKQGFKKYAKQVVKNAEILTSGLKKHKLNLVTGGTDTHLLLIDFSQMDMTGNLVAEGLEEANIIVNKNAVPFECGTLFYPSGIRLGTPGITSRGMKEKEMKMISSWIGEIILDLVKIKQKFNFKRMGERNLVNRRRIVGESRKIKNVKKEVKQLCSRFPIRSKHAYILGPSATF